MPRGLTEEEKEYQKQVLLQQGQKLIFRHGFNKVSIDDIVREAGVAKGTFYHFFSSKDDFLYDLIFQIHTRGFGRIKEVIEKISQLPSTIKREKIKEFFQQLFHSPELNFFTEQHDEMRRFLQRYSREGLVELEKMEENNYKQLFAAMGIAKDKKPEVVQNFVHITFLGISHKEVMVEEYLNQTIDVLVEGLLDYLEV